MVLAHLYELTAHPTELSYLSIIDSFIAVSGFFVISGFLITLSYDRSRNLKDYFIKRARRLLPAYILIIILCAFGLSLISSLSLNNYFCNGSFYKYIFSNLTFLNFLNPCLPGVFNSNYACAINGSLWTIKIEVSFYIILPVIIYFIKKTGKASLILMILYLGALLHNFILFKIFEKLPNKSGLYFTLTHQLPALMPFFISGMALHYYFDKIALHKNKLLLVALPVFLMERYLHYEILSPIALAVIIFYFSYNFKALNNWGKFGDFSYGIYIFHFPVIQLFINSGLFKKLNPIITSSLVIFVVLILSILSWHLLETKFLEKKSIQYLKNNI